MMWSHGPFVGASWTAAAHGMFELAALSGLTLLLSIAYHRSYEKPGRLCAVESIFAKLLFVYGVLQLIRAPKLSIFSAELLLCLGTIICFLATNFNKSLYDTFHVGMHYLPAAWCFLVAVFHKPFFF